MGNDETKNISQYQLIKKYGFSTGQLDRLRKNGNINSYTLDTLCKILDCKLEDIAELYDTINYEVLSGISERVPRVYID